MDWKGERKKDLTCVIRGMIVVVVIVVESLSHVRLFVTPWSVTWQASLHHLLEFAQTHVHLVVVGSALQMETQLEVKGKNDKELYELEL